MFQNDMAWGIPNTFFAFRQMTPYEFSTRCTYLTSKLWIIHICASFCKFGITLFYYSYTFNNLASGSDLVILIDNGLNIWPGFLLFVYWSFVRMLDSVLVTCTAVYFCHSSDDKNLWNSNQVENVPTVLIS